MEVACDFLLLAACNSPITSDWEGVLNLDWKLFAARGRDAIESYWKCIPSMKTQSQLLFLFASF